LTWLIQESNAVNYYYSSSTGSDSYSAAQAQNPATPWKTIDKLNASMSLINPGDSILFKRGEVFTGQITLTRSGTANARIVFGAYGSGKAPVIKGTLPVTGWTNYSSNIWVADCPQLDTIVTNFFINDVSQQIGRYPNADEPNSGYLNIDSHSGHSSITSSSLTSLTDPIGGILVIRTQRYYIEQSPIESKNASTITIKNPTYYEIKDNFGFFIQNHLSTLDKNGEWCFNEAIKKIYLFHLSDPNTKITEATVFSTIFEAIDRQNFSIENIELKGSLKTTIRIQNSNNVELRNNSITESGSDAINVIGCNNVSITNNKIIHTNSNALVLIKCSNNIVNNNEISCTGLRPGMGYKIYYDRYIGSFLEYTGLYLHSSNTQCELNKIDSTGYIGIYFDLDSVLIKNNFINHYCMVLDDGGGIYSYNGAKDLHVNRRLENNIILNGFKPSGGTDNRDISLARGIFMDYGSDHIIVIGNTIAGGSDYGIFNNYSNNVAIIGNTVFNNAKQIGFNSLEHMIPSPVSDYTVQGNIFYSKSADQLVAEIMANKTNEIPQFGTFDYNYYCRPSNDFQTIQVVYPANSSPLTFIVEKYDLKNWQNLYNLELHSTLSPYKLPMFTIIGATESNRFNNGTFETNISGWGCWTPYNNCSTVWDNDILDNGCLKLNFTSSSGKTDGRMFISQNIGEVVGGENYILKFSMISSLPERKIVIAMRMDYASHEDIAASQNIIVTPTRREYELLFAPDSSESNARIDLVIQEDEASYWMDNASFYKASTQMTATEDSIKFIYNPTNLPMIFNDNIHYVDARGYGFYNFELQPYTSLILLKDTSIEVPDQIIISSIFIYSESGENRISRLFEKLQLKAVVYPVDAADKSFVWEIQNGTGQASIDENGLVSAISNGKVTAIARATDGSGITGIFEIVIDNQPVEIDPNDFHKPEIYISNSRLNVILDDSEDFERIQLFDIPGRILIDQVLEKTSWSTNVAHFYNGIYIVVLSGKESILSRKVLLYK
jgi:hypothetical protein